MPAVIFFACLDLEQKSSFLDGHYLTEVSRFFYRERLQIPLLIGVWPKLNLILRGFASTVANPHKTSFKITTVQRGVESFV